MFLVVSYKIELKRWTEKWKSTVLAWCLHLKICHTEALESGKLILFIIFSMIWDQWEVNRTPCNLFFEEHQTLMETQMGRIFFSEASLSKEWRQALLILHEVLKQNWRACCKYPLLFWQGTMVKSLPEKAGLYNISREVLMIVWVVLSSWWIRS